MAASTVRSRVAIHRAQLRRRGLRPIQLRVPDTKAPGFAEEARRQVLAVSRAPDAEEVMTFLEGASAFDAEDEPGPDAPR